jgi:hypothetical protein
MVLLSTTDYTVVYDQGGQRVELLYIAHNLNARYLMQIDKSGTIRSYYSGYLLYCNLPALAPLTRWKLRPRSY